MSNSTTIAAISTAPGIGGIAVIRLSGPDAFPIAMRHCSRIGNLSFSSATPIVRYCHFFTSISASRSSFLDEVVVTFFPQGHSYTGESVVEFSCHGSIYVQQQLLQALLDDGACLAEPGEFTRRAFLNGRLNLSQAEAVADLIESTTATSHALAVSQLRGGYAQRLQQLRQQFVDLTALLELELDFSDEEVEFVDRSQMLSLLNTLSDECQSLVDSFQWGNAVKQGVPVAIIGAPNVGKSTLLNALVGEDRAIVSNIPGTTRDTIEDQVSIGGILFRIIDTAGIRQHTDDAIETEGVQRSFRTLLQARIVLYLIDPIEDDSLLESKSMGMDLLDKFLSDNTSAESRPFVLRLSTKADLITSSMRNLNCEHCDLCISAKTGEGLDLLKQRLLDVVAPHTAVDGVLLTNLRHYEAIRNVSASLCQVREGLLSQRPADLVVIDLREALYHLGTITGEVSSNEVLGTIFSRFCIGK